MCWGYYQFSQALSQHRKCRMDVGAVRLRLSQRPPMQETYGVIHEIQRRATAHHRGFLRARFFRFHHENYLG